jgi:hypothetical protein
VTLTREQLHEQVWSTPMRHLAKQYGLSDVGLAKLCEKHSIPRPPQGYWIRKEHGKADPRIPLPAIADEALQKITLQAQNAGALYVDESVVAERRTQNRITVPERLRNPHPLVAATVKALRCEEPDHEGLIRARGRDILPVTVTATTLSRAMRIMHALIIALEKGGHSLLIETSQDGGSTMYAVIERERVEFALREARKQEPHVVTADEERALAISTWRTVPLYDLRPTGRLRLEIATYSNRRVRRLWQDGKKQSLENCLNEVIISFLTLANEAKARRQHREEELRRRQEWERHREEKLRLIQQEERRVEELVSAAEAWHQSHRIRAYLNAVRDAAINAPVEDGSELAQWLTWADNQADRLDPLTKSPLSIIDEKSKWERGPGYW